MWQDVKYRFARIVCLQGIFMERDVSGQIILSKNKRSRNAVESQFTSPRRCKGETK